MKKILFIACLFVGLMAQAQKPKPTFKAEGDLVKATYYYEDGSVFRQGFFKDGKLTGQWTEFDKKGSKVAIGYYKKGKKVGTWFRWKGNTLRQINYQENVIASVSTWKEDTKVASNR